MTEKESIRSVILKKRNSLNAGIIKSAEKSGTERILSFIRDMESARGRKLDIMSYMSFRSEFPTHTLNGLILSSGHRLVLPYTDPQLVIRPFYVNDLNALRISKFGIPEPDPDTSAAPDTAPDLIIMPGIAFDSSGSRIGFGKGCYDRFLSGLAVYDVCITAAAYSFQVLERVPSDEHDIPCSVIFTENDTIYCDHTSCQLF